MPRATANSSIAPAQQRRCRFTLSPHYRPAVLSLLLIVCGVLSTPALALRSDRDQPINIVADTSEVDAKTGYTRISGGVVITQGSLVVHADEARVHVNNGKVNRVELDGQPATWEQRLENGEDMDARAQHIDYRVPDGVIELTGNALVNHPQGEISGASLQYELDSEKLRGFSQNVPGGDRVRIRIEPDAVDSGGILENVGNGAAVEIDTPPSDTSASDSSANDASAGDAQPPGSGDAPSAATDNTGSSQAADDDDNGTNNGVQPSTATGP